MLLFFSGLSLWNLESARQSFHTLVPWHRVMDKYKKVKIIGKGAFGAAVLVQSSNDAKQQFVIKCGALRCSLGAGD